MKKTNGSLQAETSSEFKLQLSEIVTQANGPEQIARDGDDLLVQLPGGELLRIEGFFSGGALESPLKTASGAELTAGMLQSMFPWLTTATKLAQQENGVRSDATPAGADPESVAVARVKESVGEVKVIRASAEISLKSGDLVLDGDVLVTGDKARAKLEFFGPLRGSVQDLLADGSIGPGARVTVSVAEEGSPRAGEIQLFLNSGNVIIENLGAVKSSIVVVTSAGQIASTGLGVAVGIIPESGETVVTTLQGIVAGNVSGAVTIQAAQAETQLSVPGQTIVISPLSGLISTDVPSTLIAATTETIAQTQASSASSGTSTTESTSAVAPTAGDTSSSTVGTDSVSSVSTGSVTGSGSSVSLTGPVSLSGQTNTLAPVSAPLSGNTVSLGSSTPESSTSSSGSTSTTTSSGTSTTDSAVTLPPLEPAKPEISPTLSTPPIIPEVSLSMTSATVGESAGTIQIAVVMSSSTSLTVRLTLALGGLNGDPRLPESVDIVINPGDSGMLVDIPITGDLVRQSTLSLTAEISAIENGTIKGGAVTFDLTDTQPLIGSSASDLVQAGDAGEQLDGGGGNDTVQGGLGNDTLLGGIGNDTVSGGAGDDLIDGGVGADVLSGGEGNDTFVFDAADTSIDGGVGNNTLKISGDADLKGTTVQISNIIQLDLSSDPEALNRIELSGARILSMLPASMTPKVFTVDGDAGDVIHVTEQWFEVAGPTPSDGYRYYQMIQNGETVTLRLGGGVVLSATLSAPKDSSGNDLPATLLGGSGGDTLNGGTANDTITGGEGADSVAAGAGNDTVDGGAGDDSIDGGLGNDTILGGSGNDTVAGGEGDDLIDGGVGADVLSGGAGNDTLVFDPADTSINGGEGSNTLKISGNTDLNTTTVQITNISKLDLSSSPASVNRIELSAATIAGMLPAGETVFTVDGEAGDIIHVTEQWLEVAGPTPPDGYRYYQITENGQTYTLKLGGGVALSATLTPVQDSSGNDLPATMVGGSGGDNLSGGTADDSIAGGEGSDTIAAGAGADSVDGGTGDDSIDGGEGNDTILGGAGADSVAGGEGADSIDGGDGNDTVAGGTGNDTVDGGAGNDLVDGGEGADHLYGGAGDDVMVFDPADLTVDGGTGNNSLKFGADVDLTSSTVAITNIQTLDLTGDGNQQLTLSYTALAAMLPSGTTTMTVEGNAGDKIVLSDQWVKGSTVGGYVKYTKTEGGVTLTLRVKAEVGVQLNIVGTNADDSLLGDLLNDTLSGGAGNDTLNGGLGADSLAGGSGDDIYVVDDAGDTVVEVLADGTDTGGTDTVQTNLSSYVLGNAVENLVITGTSGASGTGNALANTFNSGAGNDTLAGGGGNDIYIVDSGDTVTESANEGIDTVKTDSASYTLAANLENLEYTGVAFTDLTGNVEANRITGGASGDTLSGADGNDTLDGGAGSDSLVGGAGNDVYLVDDAGDTTTEAASKGTDTVQTTLATYTLQANIENLEYTGSGNATLTGNTEINRITGGAGNDLLDGGTGADSLYGGLGNDTLVFDANDVVVDGGDGSDTLYLKTATTNFLSGALPSNIEVLEMRNSVTGGSANSVMLNAAKVKSMLSAGNDTLVVEGDAGDAIEVTESWTSLGQTVAGYNDYSRATSGGTVILRMKAGILLNQVVTGTPGNDTLPGGLGNDNISGLAGDDLLTGADGADILKGNEGNDTLDGGVGNDTMYGGSGNDIYVLEEAGDVVNEERNTDTGDEIQTSRSTLSLADYTAIEHLTFLSNDNSTGTGNDSANRITGKAGDDTLAGGAGNDTLIGNGGNDQLDGGTGTDSMAGGTGSDFYRVDDASDVVTEALNQGDDTIETGLATYTLADNVERLNLTNTAGVTATGNTLANTITGNIGNDSLSGADGSDTLIGAAGNDTLDGGTGEDSLVGGAGNDIYFIDNVNDVVDEGSNTDAADEVRSSLASTTLADNIEKLTLSKADGATGIGNALDNQITGAAGNDSLRGAEGNDTLEGAAGNDTLEGGVGNDSLVGGVNDDLLDGGEGNDTLDGGAGNDVYLVDSSNDSIIDASGTDEIRTTLNAYTIAAGIETLKFTGQGDFVGTGTSTAETLIGGSGADTLDGQGGSDRLEGGFGNDRYLISTALATIIENSTALATIIENTGEGIDEVVTGLDNYTLAANVEKLTLTKTDGVTATGNASANTITGNAGNDNLSGGAGKDTLIGAAGDDTLSGGTDADYLEGGDGNDVYHVDHADDQVIEAAVQGTDTIRTTLTNVILADNVESLIYTAADFTAAGTGNFKATGNADANTIVGGSGNDTLDGGLGADSLVGGEGNDIYIVDASDKVTETGSSTGDEIWTTADRTAGSGIENLTSIASVGITLTGNTEANTLKGNINLNVDDTLLGGDGVDTLYGYAGNDSLDGGTGADSLIGGAGNDIYRVDDSSDVVVEGADSGLDKVFSSLAAYTLTANVEDLVLTKADNASGTGNALDNLITGAAGNDTLDGAAGNDTLIGGDGNDVYITDGNDVIVESGTGSADEVHTAANFSLANLSTVENLTSVASTGLELTGNAGANILKGNDTASAANGADTLDGGAGADSLYGYDGNDVYIVDNVGDQVFEDANKGTDEIKTSLSSLTLATNVEKLTYTGTGDFTGTGTSGNETITGATGNDTLIGLAGDDSLAGGVGNDVLRGGAGNDTLSGGDGVDIADYSGESGPLTLSLATGTATIGSDTDTLSSIEGVIGTTAADNITGGSGNDFLDGNGGNDVLTGGDGDDIYVVNGTDSYTIVEDSGLNSGIDELRIRPVGDTVTNFVMPTNVEKLTFISSGNLTISGSGYITGGTGNDTITTSTGNDTLDGGMGGNDDLRGGGGDDVYIIRNQEDSVTDSAGTDEIRTDLSSYTLAANVEKLTYIGPGNFSGTGAAGDETITGGAGNDTLSGAAGNDSLVGGDGFDIANYSASTAAVDVDLANQTVSGGAGNDTLSGVEGVVGSAYADTLTGSAGDDYLDAGSGGADTLTGGAGNDIYVINHSDTVSITDTSGFDTVRTNQDSFTLASFSNVEGLEYTGSSNVNLVGNADGNLLSSGAGTDTLEGGDGNDTLNGGAGVDTLTGGAGDDLFIVDGDLDVVNEGINGGTDTIRTSLATYTLAANVENLEFTGSGAVNFTGSNVGNALTGGAGNDTLDGGAGSDILTGGAGDDIYYVDNVADSLVELANGGSDEARVSVTGYTLAANVEKGTVNTTTGIRLTANALNNTLVGNTGDDTLDGGAGQDTMQGGDGDDVYVVDNLRDVVTDSGGSADEVQTTLSSYAIGGSTGIEKLTYTGSGNFDGRGDTGSQTITGGSGDDTLDGGAGADRLVGGDGNNIFLVDEQGDTVVGGSGTDEVRTSAATLTMANMSGVEQVTYTGSSDANLTGGSGNDILVGGIGKDTLSGGGGNDTLRGGANNDIYIVDSQNDVIEEKAGEGVDEVKTSLNTYTLNAANVEKLSFTGTGTFTATGNASDNVITGGSGADILDGGTGADTLVGGDGNDIYYIDNEADVITETSSGGSADEMRTTLANITLAANVEKLTYIGTAGFTAVGTSGADSISGGSGNDSLSGLAGNDTLSGGEGNDTLDGGTGTDSLVGGAGDDVYVIDSASDVIVEGASAGTDEIRVTFNTAYTLSTANIENLAFAGSSGGGNLTGDGNANKITGGDGNDTLSGAAGNDTLIGGAGQDSLSGGADNDSLAGGDGNDTLIGGTGSDTLAGGAGADIYRVDDANVTLIEASGDGTDTVETTLTSYTLTEGVFVEKLAYKNVGYTGEGTSAFTGTGNSLDNEITGGSAADNLKGLDGNDTLIGGAGADTLDGGTGIDSLVGGAGNDVYIVDNEGDIISETGSDTGDEVRATATSYVLGSGIEKLTYVQSDGVTAGTGDFTGTGSSGNETITGGSGNDALAGMAGADKLIGGDGNDTLDGGAGTDTLEGGAGNDLYIVDSTSDVVTDTGGTADEIRSTAASFSMAAAGYNAIENLSYSGLANANLTGNTSNNVITGSVGDDTLDGGTGTDTLVGGAGNDVYKVDNAGDTVTETGTDSADEIQTAVSFSIATLANIENLTSTAGGVVTLTGNDAANVIKGNSATAYAETLSGGLGNDTLYGYGANDSLDGGDGNDSLDGGVGDDTLVGGAGNDTLAGGAGNDIYIIDATTHVVTEAASAGTDEIRVTFNTAYTLATANVENLGFAGTGAANLTGDANANQITGGSGNDILAGAAGIDTLIGNAGDDSLDGGAGNDSLSGGDGNDVLDGGNDTVVDTLIGGLGDDVYIAYATADSWTEAASAGSDTIRTALTSYTLASANIENLEFTSSSNVTGTGDANANTITGFTGNDTLSGAVGNDTIYGGAGNDSIDGGAGNDSLIGGEGNDVYTVDAAGDVIVEASDQGTDEVKTALTTGYTLSDNVEKLTLSGTNARGTGNQLDNLITGAAGSDTLSGADGNDTLIGAAGNDVLDGGAGADSIDGGDGNDVIYYDVDDVRIEGGVGSADRLVIAGTTVVDLTAAGVSGTRITNIEELDLRAANGGTGANQLLLNATAIKALSSTTDTLIIHGDFGDRVVLTDGWTQGSTTTYNSLTYNIWTSNSPTGATLHIGQDVTLVFAIYGTSGNDSLTGGVNSEVLYGYEGNDTLSGNGGNDSLLGAEGNDSLDGGAGTDTVLGGADNDTLDGGTGGDNLYGEAGDDQILFDANDVLVDGGDGNDSLIVKAGTTTIDMTLADDAVFKNIERFDLSGQGAQLLKLSVNDLKAINSAMTLLVDGDVASDNVRLLGASTLWAVTTDVAGYVTYSRDGATVNVKVGVDVGFVYPGSALADRFTGSAGSDEFAGLDGDDSFAGGAAIDLISGGSGNDTLLGDAGNDQIDAGAGDDSIEGGADNDSILGGAGNDRIYGDDAAGLLSGNDTIASEDGDDTVYGGAGADSIAAGTGDDRIYGDAGNDTLDGSDGFDLLVGGEGNDSLTGGINDDTLIGGAGNDTLDGGAGAGDWADFSGETGAGNINLATGVATIGGGTDSLIGIENVKGNTAANTITGSTTGNRIDGLGGSDSISAGDGTDAIVYYDGDTVDGGSGTDTLVLETGDGVENTIELDLTTLADTRILNIEEFDLTAVAATVVKLNDTDLKALSSTTDTLIVHGNANDVIILAGSWVSAGTQPVTVAGVSTAYNKFTLNGATILIGPLVKFAVEITGGTGADNMTGSAGEDTLRGGAGNDTIDGLGGRDALFGDANDDTIKYDNADATVDGGLGVDTLQVVVSGKIIDLQMPDRRPVLSNLEKIDLNTTGANYLVVDAQTIAALSTETSVAGNLTVIANSSDFIFVEGTRTGTGPYTITTAGVSKTLTISGTVSWGNYIRGTSGDDAALNGVASATPDLIHGDAGNDTIDGLSGTDIIYGDAGNDVIVFDNSDLLIDGGADADTLQVAGSGVTVDLTAKADDIIFNVETIDLTGTGNNTLTLNAADVAAINALSKEIAVIGNAGDVLNLIGGWVRGADVSGKQIFTLDGSKVVAASALTININWTGTTLNDTLVINDTGVTGGDRGAQNIQASDGNDRLDGKGGADTLSGGNGDDVLVADIDSVTLTIADASVDGGAGLDTLLFTSENQKLDLTTNAVTTTHGEDKLKGIETIDLTGTGANIIVLGANDLLNLSDTTDTLILNGDADDTMRLSGTWVAAGSAKVNGITYNQFTATATNGTTVTLLAGLDITRGNVSVGGATADALTGGVGSDALTGGAGNDTLDGVGGSDELYGGADDDRIVYDAADQIADGGTGSDTLAVSSAGNLIDLQESARPTSGAVRPALVNFEQIDLNTSDANYLILDAASFRSLTGVASGATTLLIAGSAADIVFIDGALGGDLTLTLNNGVTQRAVIAGTAGNDMLSGADNSSYTIDAIKAGAGKDTIDAGLGADIVYGQDGDDVLVFDAADLLIDGGAGSDTLLVKAVDSDWNATTTLNTTADDIDFTIGAGTKYVSIETIDLTGNGHQTIRLDEASVLAMSPTGVITVKGNNDATDGDTLKLYGAWVNTGVESGSDGNLYYVMQKGDAFVKVDKRISLGIVNELGGNVAIGTDTADIVTVPSGGGAQTNDGDDTIFINDTYFTGVDGGRGYDTVKLASGWVSGGAFNATLMAPSSLTNIEQIDLTGRGTNKLILSAGNVLDMTDSAGILVVSGDTVDSVEFRGTWTLQANVSYNGVTYKDYAADNGAHVYYQTTLATATFANPTPQLNIFSVDYRNAANFTNVGIDELTGIRVENVGDANGDKVADFVINQNGQAYLIFGGSSLYGDIDLDNLGTKGIKISNVQAVTRTDIAFNNYDATGNNSHEGSKNFYSFGVTGAGDVNGDGLTDLLVAVNDYNASDLANSGETYAVIYGRRSWSNVDAKNFSVSTTNGFRLLNGPSMDSTNSGQVSTVSQSVSSLGDINGDGYADFLVANSWENEQAYSSTAALDTSTSRYQGKAYVVFGSARGADLDLASPGSSAISLTGVKFDNLGADVSAVGDINNDGYADFVVGAPSLYSYDYYYYSYYNGYTQYAAYNTDVTGGAYVVFGKASGWANVTVTRTGATSGSNGYVYLDGGDATDYFMGRQVQGVGDVNGDGIADFVVGTANDVSDQTNSTSNIGKYYLVFGRTGAWDSTKSLSTLASEGKATILTGASGNMLTSVATLGDFNKDGYADLLVTAAGSGIQTANNQDPNASDDGDVNAGAAFIVYGKATWASSTNVTNLGSGGLQIAGGLPYEQFGFSATAGDFNGDGKIDLLFGQPDNHRNGFNSGAAYLLAGGDYSGSLMSVGTASAETMVGDFNANTLAGQGGDDAIYGLGGADILRGGTGNDTIGLSDKEFILLDGGTGTDLLKFIGNGIHIDMTGVAGASLRSFEKIDLTGDGNNTLTLNYREVLDLLERKAAASYGTQAVLTINGNAGDVVNLESPWFQSGTSSIGGVTYNNYLLEGIKVQVAQAITTNVVGWTIPKLGAQIDLNNLALNPNLRTTLLAPGTTNTGQTAGSYFGTFQSVGDVNNDGYVDFMIGSADAFSKTYYALERSSGSSTAYQSGTEATYTAYRGNQYVIYGKAGGLAATANVYDLTNSTSTGLRYTGGVSGEMLGSGSSKAAGGIGDINGDGIQDFAIGSPRYYNDYAYQAREGYDYGSYMGTYYFYTDYWTYQNEGRVYVINGQTSLSGGTVSSMGSINPENANSYWDTLRNTANKNDSTLERAYTNSTGVGDTEITANFISSTTNAFTGQVLSALGDINGDGFDDFIYSEGMDAKVVLGRGSMTGTNPTTQKVITLTGMGANSLGDFQLNRLYSGAGDVNGDGYDDFYISNATGGTNKEGEGWLVFGGPTATYWASTKSVTLAQSSTASGNANLWYTYTKGSVALSGTGHRTSSLGDINGDGYDDLLFSSTGWYGSSSNGSTYLNYDTTGTYEGNHQFKQDGAGYIMLGGTPIGNGNDRVFDSTMPTTYKVAGATDFERAGWSLSGVGDVNGDGYDDLVLVAPGEAEATVNSATNNGGSSYLLFGKASGWGNLNLVEVQNAGLQILGKVGYTSEVTGLGDIDGDGLDDIGFKFSNSASGATVITQILYGSEYLTDGVLDGVQRQSTTAAANFTGTSGADRLLGNAGADTLTGAGGADVIYGGAGNDVMSVSNNSFLRIDGGTGTDILKVGFSLDLTSIGDSKLQSIEVIDMTDGASGDTLSLTALEVLNMTESKNMALTSGTYQKAHVLVVTGDAGDVVNWTDSGWNYTDGGTTTPTYATGSSGYANVPTTTNGFTVYQHGTDNIYVAVKSGLTWQ